MWFARALAGNRGSRLHVLIAMVVLAVATNAEAQRTSRPTDTQGVTGNPNCPPPKINGITPKNWSCATGTQSTPGPTVQLPGIGAKSCVTQSSWETVDRTVSSLPQTGRTNDDSFNCFYYLRAYVEGAMPPEYPPRPATDPRRSWDSPARAYADDVYLRLHGYTMQALHRQLDTAGYEPGDVIMVPGRDPAGRFAGIDQRYVHAAIVVATRAGRITRIRQKVDPFKCVVDLTPQEFRTVYALSGDDMYEIWRRK